VPLQYQHFAVDVFFEEQAEIHPIWSGEGNLSYFILNPQSKAVVLIDPDLEILGSYLLTLDQNQLRLVGVIDTHTHAEHATAAPLLRELFQVPYLMHQQAPSQFVTDRVKDGEQRTLGGMTFQFLHTPGHTVDMTSIRLGKRLFTGDSLFNKSCGRTDLPGGDAGHQYQSIHQLAQFPDDFTIHPGHDYNNHLSSPLSVVSQHNHRLQISSQAEFIDFMTTHYAKEEKPDNLDYYVAFNAR
jgi:glyoxylase-like metal-dependent hydrolase (beta-lactamase superfamily II)